MRSTIHDDRKFGLFRDTLRSFFQSRNNSISHCEIGLANGPLPLFFEHE